MISTLLNISINRPIKAVLTTFVGAIIGIICVYFVPIHFDVQMRTENTGSLQYFYNTGAGFNEVQSKRIQLSGGAEFTHYHISIRPYALQAIRIDPIETKGQFELLGFNVDYLIWHRQWYGGSELSNLFSTHAVDVKSSNGSSLVA